MEMYRKLQTPVKVNGVLNEELEVEVGFHQAPVLSPPLLIMILEAASQTCRSGLPFRVILSR